MNSLAIEKLNKKINNLERKLKIIKKNPVKIL